MTALVSSCLLVQSWDGAQYSYSEEVPLESYANTLCAAPGGGAFYVGGKQGYFVRIAK